MVELEFEIDQDKIIVQANLTDSFNNVLTHFYTKTNIEPDSVVFMVRASKIQGDKKISELINEEEKQNKIMHIKVFRNYNSDKNDKVIVDSKQVICPKCSEHCRIKIEDYIIKLSYIFYKI